MKKNHALMMALSALSAGLLISCVKPVDDNQSTTVESQEVAPDTAINDKAADDQAVAITAVDISADTQKTYLTMWLMILLFQPMPMPLNKAKCFMI